MREASKGNPFLRPEAAAATTARRPLRLVPHYLVTGANGDVQIRTASRVSVLRGAVAQQVLPALLPLLDGTLTAGELAERLTARVDAGKVRSVLKLLLDKGIAEEVAPPPPALGEDGARRLATIIRYHGGYDVVAAVRQARVAIVGDSPLAARVSATLDHAGVGAITRPPATAGVAELTAALEGVTTAVAIVDGPAVFQPSLHALNEAAIAARVPWTSVALLGRRALQLGPTVSPGETACLGCLRAQLERHLAFVAPVLPFDRLAEVSRGDGAPSDAQLALATSLASIEILRASAPGQDCLTYGRIYTIDLDRFESSFQLVAKVPRCPVCGPTRDAPKMRIWS